MAAAQPNRETKMEQPAPAHQEVPEPPALRHQDVELHHARRREAAGARARGVPGRRRQERRGPHAQILLQIILEEESGGAPMFSHDMLSQIIRFYGNAMQGMMGSYLEQNIQTLQEIQKTLQDQSQQIYGDNSRSTPELWAQFMKMQGPAMQGLMRRYLEQSAEACSRRCSSSCRARRATCSPAFPFPGFPARRQGDARRAPIARQASRRLRTRRAAPRVGFVSLGCPKALVDSERILTQLRAEGYAIAPDLRGRRPRRRQHLRLHRRRGRGIARRDRRGAGRERQGDRHRLPRREGRRRRGDPSRRCSPSPARTRRRGDGGGARAPAASRTIRSSIWCRRRASSSRRGTTRT